MSRFFVPRARMLRMSETFAHERVHFQHVLREIGEQLLRLEDFETQRREEFRLLAKTNPDQALVDERRALLNRYREHIRDWRSALLDRLLETVSLETIIDERRRIMDELDEVALADLEADDPVSRTRRRRLIHQEQYLNRLLRLPFDVDQHVLYSKKHPYLRGFLAPNGDMLGLNAKEGWIRLLNPDEAFALLSQDTGSDTKR